MKTTMKLTMKDTKLALVPHGINIKYNASYNEYRVSYKDIVNSESSAYYTDDLTDAIYTGMTMAENRTK